eukprot:g942.t1
MKVAKGETEPVPLRSRCDPGKRRGHSLSLWSDQSSDAKKVILFGGRDNDKRERHTPSTYEVLKSKGTISITSYEGKLLNNNSNTLVDVGMYYNDVWVYDLSCSRQGDKKCTAHSWRQLHPGRHLGGCRVVEQNERCYYPTERYEHTANIFGNFLYIYGGYSTFCTDYCNDMWRYNLTFDTDVLKINGEWALTEDKDVTHNPWTLLENYDMYADHPGKRWRLASAATESRLFIFGGYRLWHGFLSGNDLSNDWKNHYTERCIPADWDTCTEKHNGGYLDDLWEFDTKVGRWNRVVPLLDVEPDIEKRFFYDSRDAMKNVTYWPTGRAGHSLLLVRNQWTNNMTVNINCDANPSKCNLYLWGGFRAFFPYPLSTSSGAGDRTQSLTTKGYGVYPNYPFYLNDMWRFNLATRKWRRVTQTSPETEVPSPRMEHILVQSGVMLILFGGYADNVHMNDIWYFNLTRESWLQKKTHVYALYPDECCQIRDPNLPGYCPAQNTQNGEVYGMPTKISQNLTGLNGAVNDTIFILQQKNQKPGWDGCRHRFDGRQDLNPPFPNKLLWREPYGTSMHKAVFIEKPEEQFLLVYGGHGYEEDQLPLKYQTHSTTVKDKFWQFNINKCPDDCNGQGRCSYGYCFCDVGYYGLDCSNISCPGDYCRYDEVTNEQICKHCCSAPFKHHTATWNDTSRDRYYPHMRKVPCDADHVGTSNGICDGFGQCQCNPPYIGDDCSIKDCPINDNENDPNWKRKCSGHGWCSVEYPVSRCICERRYRGLDCRSPMCLNNCSWPNGDCVDGTCVCKEIIDPYNNTRQLKGKWWFAKYEGRDCSWLVPFAAASRIGPLGVLLSSIFIIGMLFII